MLKNTLYFVIATFHLQPCQKGVEVPGFRSIVEAPYSLKKKEVCNRRQCDLRKYITWEMSKECSAWGYEVDFQALLANK